MLIPPGKKTHHHNLWAKFKATLLNSDQEDGPWLDTDLRLPEDDHELATLARCFIKANPQGYIFPALSNQGQACILMYFLPT